MCAMSAEQMTMAPPARHPNGMSAPTPGHSPPGYRPMVSAAPLSYRLWNIHMCGFHDGMAKPCCMIPSNFCEMYAFSIEHLPVCHDKCFKRELEKMQKSTEKLECYELPLCHRACYYQAIRKKRGYKDDLQIVPLHRTMKERLGVSKLVHKLMAGA
ncbi:hypothetical protein LTR08_008472 [Meristemomyces frigidus]|nr:hypothetical protein LTR08_008472 [Meristemomyces frigidus]